MMVRISNKSLATALLCGAMAFAGTALAQGGAAGGAGVGAAGGAETNATGAGVAGDNVLGSSNAVGGVHTGPGQIERSTPPTGALNGNNSSYGASGNATASASGSSQTEKPEFLGSVQSKSTPARGLKGAAMQRVDQNERRITAELNRAAASGTGNANVSNQASINSGTSSSAIQ